MTTPHPQSLSPLRGEGSQGRRCRASWALGLRATRCRSSASLRWWTKSRCDSVCLRSRHFVARLRRGLAHDAIAIQTTRLSQGFNRRNLPANPWAVGRVTPGAPLLTSQRTSFLQPPPSQCFTLETTTNAPQTGHPPCPREPPMVDEVALRLRLPAEQALCGVALPGACA